jgi:hypothetical protein
MAWTVSQRQLRDVALTPAARPGMHLDVVRCEFQAGMTELLQALRKRAPDKREARVLNVYAGGAYEAVGNLCYVARVRQRTGMGDSSALALKALAGESGLPVCLMLEAAHLMTPVEMERLAEALDWAARQECVALRAVYLCRPIRRWVNKVQQWLVDWPTLPELFRARYEFQKRDYFRFTRAGLDELTLKDLPKDVFAAVA